MIELILAQPTLSESSTDAIPALKGRGYTFFPPQDYGCEKCGAEGEQLARNRIIIVLAHRATTLMECDSVCFLSRGRIAAQGTHQKLLESRSDYREYVEATVYQFEPLRRRANNRPGLMKPTEWCERREAIVGGWADLFRALQRFDFSIFLIATSYVLLPVIQMSCGIYSKIVHARRRVAACFKDSIGGTQNR